MTKIRGNETRIEGAWILDGMTMKEDSNCQRIRWLIDCHLQKIVTDEIYPQSGMQGGGPPVLQNLSKSLVAKKYKKT